MLNAVARQRLLEMMFDQNPRVDELLAFQLGLSAEAEADLQAAMAGAEIDPIEVARYLGAYRHLALGEATLYWRDEDLIFDAGEVSSPIVAVIDADTGEVTYITTTPPLAGVPIAFEEDEDGDPIIVFGLGVAEYILELVR